MLKDYFEVPNKPAIKSGNILSCDFTDHETFIPQPLDFTRNTSATYIDCNGFIAEAGVDIPRIDYTTEIGKAKELQKPSLLLEPQSTNLVPYSEDFTQSNWLNIGSPTITPNYGISPDGTLNSTRVQFASSSNSLYDAISHTIGDTASIYVKGVSGETIQFGAGANVAAGQLFTLNGEWQRIESQSNGNSVFCIGTFQSATARNIEVFGAQLEALSYATSYIPTSGSTITRNQDVANNAGQLGVFNDTEGVLYAEIAALADDLTTFRSISINADSTRNDQIMIRYRTGVVNVINFFIRDGGSVTFNNNVTVQDVTKYHKVALKYKDGDIACWVDGEEKITSPATGMPLGLSRLGFVLEGASVDPFFGKVKEVKAFRRALTDSELQELTNNIV